MASSLPLRAALKHGALITAANWPVVLIEFVLESLYKFALVVPVVGGAFMVAVLLGEDLGMIFGQGVRAAADLIVGSLATAPAALLSFFGALTLVALGGSIVMYIVKGGTLWVLVASERVAGDLHRGPIHLDALRRAYAYDLATLLERTRRFGRRSALLAAGLGLSYLAIGWGYVFALTMSFHVAAETTWTPAWPLLVLLATSTSVIAVAAVNLGFDLLRVIVITDDCRIRTALARLRAFLVADSRQVLGIFGVIGALVALAMAVSVVATAGLAFVAWVPVASLIAVPLQVAAWLVRGIVFQYVGLTGLSAYQTQYRRFADPDSRPLTTPLWVQRA
ncbi:MAG TPA: hypothetical protein VLT86_12450 [Vicinamibacterales bacterium]|nr:hypothetical protein [Vicinamibacterales bacterium]